LSTPPVYRIGYTHHPYFVTGQHKIKEFIAAH